MQPLVTPLEILSIYTFDFFYFFSGTVAFMAFSFAVLLVLTIVIPIVVRSRDISQWICSFIVSKLVFVAIALSFAAGYFYQEYQRQRFADALAQALAARQKIEISLPDSQANDRLTVNSAVFRVPHSTVSDLNTRLMEPRKIPFEIPKSGRFQ